MHTRPIRWVAVLLAPLAAASLAIPALADTSSANTDLVPTASASATPSPSASPTAIPTPSDPAAFTVKAQTAAARALRVTSFARASRSGEERAMIRALAARVRDTERIPGISLGPWLASDRSIDAGSPRDYALFAVLEEGWPLSEWACLDRLWFMESHWSATAGATSRAYGIPQALPASKMASAGDDWRSNPITQVRWGLSYIEGRYHSPCGALDAWKQRAANGAPWY